MSDAIKAIEPAAAPKGAARFGVSDGKGDGRAAAAAGSAGVAGDGEADLAALQQAFAELSQQLARNDVDLTYRVDGDLHRVIVEVVDRRDGTVLRQIPGEEALRLARMMRDGHGGLLQVQA
ncbi:flagellar protein FlaG [Solimonas soli]|uniref:flagellar protein FlaG n=1 Tax=Solimonas soli TaxID=413479 RepID=UPI000484350B|nr:flagellar protein FlaG [Solimonas soli]